MEKFLISACAFMSIGSASVAAEEPVTVANSSEKYMLVYCEPAVQDGSGMAWGVKAQSVRIEDGKMFAVYGKTDIKTNQMVEVSEEIKTEGRNCFVGLRPEALDKILNK